jgi:hypothetical protein
MDIFQDTEALRTVRLIRMEYHLTSGRRLEDLKSLDETVRLPDRSIYSESAFWNRMALKPGAE